MTPKPDHGETSYRGSGRLIGRKALITGGDSGIGRAAAIAFAREGADVAINYLPVEESDAREVVQLIENAGRKPLAIPGDIREERFCIQLVGDVVGGLGGLDLLVHVAARQQACESIAELTTEAFDWTVKTNLYALFWITKAAMPHLGAGASIITTASQQAYDPAPYLLDYSPTKAGIIAFTKALAKQVASKGIRVNAVAFGAVLDSASSHRSAAHRAAALLRIGDAVRSSRTARGNRTGLRDARRRGVQLCIGPGDRRLRRPW